MTTNTTTASAHASGASPPLQSFDDREGAGDYNLQQRQYRKSRKSPFHPADCLDAHTAAQIEAVLGGVKVGKYLVHAVSRSGHPPPSPKSSSTKSTKLSTCIALTCR